MQTIAEVSLKEQVNLLWVLQSYRHASVRCHVFFKSLYA